MSLHAYQRAALLAQTRPPGPPSMWYAIGTAVRSLGKAIDSFGVEVQGDGATIDKRTHRAALPDDSMAALGLALLVPPLTEKKMQHARP